MNQYEDRLILTSRGKIDLLDKSKIFYINSEKRKVHIHMQCEIYSLNRTLDDLEQSMGDEHFLRIHQSFLVNTRFIRRIDGLTLYLTTGEQFPVSRKYLSAVHKHFRK